MAFSKNTIVNALHKLLAYTNQIFTNFLNKVNRIRLDWFVFMFHREVMPHKSVLGVKGVDLRIGQSLKLLDRLVEIGYIVDPIT
mmetsp:Transcript_17195/g.49129  ORF Transcript_17195/g.49129 Transcript_17195/m.49129 type:complete len:84 (+) Transcript_17195:784-1035(+)